MTGYVSFMPTKPLTLAFSKARLVEMRERAGLTQQGLADLCGLTRSQISRWEIGENKPTAETLAVLVAGFRRKVRAFRLDDLLDPRVSA